MCNSNSSHRRKLLLNRVEWFLRTYLFIGMLASMVIQSTSYDYCYISPLNTLCRYKVNILSSDGMKKNTVIEAWVGECFYFNFFICWTVFPIWGPKKKSSNFVEILMGKEKRWENTFLKGVCQKNLILSFSSKLISSDSTMCMTITF